MSGRLTARQHILRVLGFIFVALGLVGAFLPLLPTTPFLLLALACFARSSAGLHDWLTGHALLGPYIVDWERDRSIPLAAKITSLVMMSASFTWLVAATSAPAIAIWMTGAILICVAVYIVTRPTSR